MRIRILKPSVCTCLDGLMEEITREDIDDTKINDKTAAVAVLLSYASSNDDTKDLKPADLLSWLISNGIKIDAL